MLFVDTRFDMYMDSIGERWDLARSKRDGNPLVAALMGPAPDRSVTTDGGPDELGRELEDAGLRLAAEMPD